MGRFGLNPTLLLQCLVMANRWTWNAPMAAVPRERNIGGVPGVSEIGHSQVRA